jgi:E3 ubiquitin-protein ligase UBR4
LPGSQTNLAVLTKSFVKIYDLSKDTISPIVYFSEIQDESGKNAMTSLTISQEGTGSNLHRIYVGTNSGKIYTYLLDEHDLVSHDALYFVEDLKIHSKLVQFHILGEIDQINFKTTLAAVDIHYAKDMKLLFVSFECGLVFFGRPKLEANGELVMQGPVQINANKIAGAVVSFVSVNIIIGPWLWNPFPGYRD